MKKRIYILFIALILLMFSCSNSGIFYRLEHEQAYQELNNLHNSAILRDLVSIGTENTTATDGYYIGNGGPNIFFRSENNTDTSVDDWAALPLPAGTAFSFSADAVISSMALLGNDLYISRISRDGSSLKSGIYMLENLFNDNGTEFDLTDDSALSDLSVITSGSWKTLVENEAVKISTEFTYDYYKLHAAYDSLYINLLRYKLSSSIDSTPELAESLLYVSDIPAPGPETINNDLTTNVNVDTIDLSGLFVVDTVTTAGDPPVATNLPIIAPIEKIISSDGTNYWMIFNGGTSSQIADTEINGKIFLSADNLFAGPPTDVAPNLNVAADVTKSSIKLSDIYEHTTAGVLLVSDTSGNIYTSVDAGTTWRDTPLTKSGIGLFHGFENIHALEPDNVIVGTSAIINGSSFSGSGYFQLNLSTIATPNDIAWSTDSGDGNFADIDTYISTDLNDSTIVDFLYGADNKEFMASTSMNGVWINKLKDALRIWARE